MAQLGDVVRLTHTDRRLELTQFVGEGSQGSVWEGVDEIGPLAVKVYFPATDTTSQRALIARLVERGHPDPRFLWPLDLTEPHRGREFGYAMPLRPAEYAGLADLLNGKVDAPFSVACRLCIELADAFLALHCQGLCYRDISFGNVFFRPETGMPLICDNDNVGIDGRSEAAVLGTRRFMAPEIVRREAAPSVHTDLYSLSVLLFYVLFMGHPLVGRRELDFPCWDEKAESKLFGVEPRFIFDPTDESNAALPDLHSTVLRHWEIFPTFVRDRFVQAFSDGLTDPVNGRVRESVWRSTLSRLADDIVRCSTCGRENFVEPDQPPPTCWNCRTVIDAPMWLRIGNHRVAIDVGTPILGHHLHNDYDFTQVVGTVEPHPSRPGLLGLCNRTNDDWRVVLGDREQQSVPSGRTVRLEPGAVIEIGRHWATVEPAFGATGGIGA